MKTIKIGRDASCNIILDHEMISRHHAILRIYPTGKIEFISMGTNGTKLNGALMKPDVVYTIKRSDMISFPGNKQLDWSLIHNPLKKYRIMLIGFVIAIVLGGLTIFGYRTYCYFNPTPKNEIIDNNATKLTNPKSEKPNMDSAVEKNDTLVNIKKKEKEKNKNKKDGISSKDFFPAKDNKKKKDVIDNNKSKPEHTDSVKVVNDSINIKEKIII